eukprot:scaffold1954_cov364-Prasinococcus_capsulatus_cf.AAC.19
MYVGRLAGRELCCGCRAFWWLAIQIDSNAGGLVGLLAHKETQPTAMATVLLGGGDGACVYVPVAEAGRYGWTVSTARPADAPSREMRVYLRAANAARGRDARARAPIL